MTVLDGYRRLCHVPWRGESVRGRSRRDFSTAILIMVVDFGIQIEIGIGIDWKDGNSTPIPIAISTGRMRSKLELVREESGKHY